MRHLARTLCILTALLAAGETLAAEAELRLPKSTYGPGEPLTVTFTAPVSDGAWVGVIPAAVPHGDEATNDEHDLDYRYLEGRAAGTLDFTAPTRAGAYDLRMNDGQGREIATVGFTVRAVDRARVSLELDTTTVAPGGEVTARFTAPGLADDAWIGIVPSTVPHGAEADGDAAQLGYQYLGGRAAGAVTLAAPGAPGSYDVRLFDTDAEGEELASASFRVARVAGGTLQLERATVLPGEAIEVRFTAPAAFPRNAWVGIVPASVPHGDEARNDAANLGWFYLEGRTSGSGTLHAPTAAGRYDLRLHDTENGGVEVATVSFTVKGDLSADDLAAQLEEKGRLALYGIRFATDSAELTAESTAALDAVAELLRDDPSLRLRIEGHTDASGDAEHNLELSRRRATSVERHLVAIHGIAADRLETAGLGASRPVGPNDSEPGRALNRRVELVRL